MNSASLIAALCLPASARVDQRVPKKLLVEHGAPTAADKRRINDGIEEMMWIAALKPGTIGVPEYRDPAREYVEIAVLSVTLRPEARGPRLIELVHRAIPYPIFLVQNHPETLSLSFAHLRWSHGHAGQTVLDGPVVTANLDAETPVGREFLASLAITSQHGEHLHALYQSWIERMEAYEAARHTGQFIPAPDAAAAAHRRIALAEHERLTREIVALRARAGKETQLNRRVDLNLKLRQLESRLAGVTIYF